MKVTHQGAIVNLN